MDENGPIVLEGPILHGTMIVGGRVRILLPKKKNHNNLHSHCTIYQVTCLKMSTCFEKNVLLMALTHSCEKNVKSQGRPLISKKDIQDLFWVQDPWNENTCCQLDEASETNPCAQSGCFFKKRFLRERKYSPGNYITYPKNQSAQT